MQWRNNAAETIFSQEEGGKVKLFEVQLTRSYVIKIASEDQDSAMRLTELFVGGEHDLSEVRQQSTFGFEIADIEMTVNEAIRAEEIESF